MDDRIGVSIGDAWAVFNVGEGSRGLLDCNPTQVYGFSPAPADTVYIPLMSGIAEGKAEVYLPIATTLQANTHAVHLPLLWSAPGSNGVYELAEVIPRIAGGLGYSDPSRADTTVLFGLEGIGIPLNLEGNRTLFSLRYVRVGVGEGEIVTDLVDRQDPLKTAVMNDAGAWQIDLYRPVIISVDVSFPMGDCNCDGRFNIADIHCIVGFLFLGWPSCEPYRQPYGIPILDVNCTGSVDITDLVYMVNYLFAAGPGPCDPFAP